MFCLLCACNKEKTQVIPEELEDYVHAFFRDARKHGNNIHIEDFDLIFDFVQLNNDSVSGRCNASNNRIEIDAALWERKSDDVKTWLIYHELGHCILGREHYNGVFYNGECQSMMCSDFISDNCSTNFFSDAWKAYYVQELFCEERILPDWYDTDATLEIITPLSYNTVILDTVIFDDRLRIDSISVLDDADFQICMTFHNWQDLGTCIHLNWDSKSLVLCDNKFTIREKVLVENTYLFNNYFQSKIGMELDDETTLCILKEEEWYYFFVDMNLIHVMDFETWVDKRVYTNSFDENMELSFKAFNF